MAQISIHVNGALHTRRMDNSSKAIMIDIEKSLPGGQIFSKDTLYLHGDRGEIRGFALLLMSATEPTVAVSEAKPVQEQRLNLNGAALKAAL